MMKRTLHTLGKILLASFVAFAAEARPEVVFPAEAEASVGAKVRLLEIAEFKDVSKEAFAELSQMNLSQSEGASEASSTSLTFTGAEISKKMRDFIAASSVLRKSNVSFKIPEALKISFVKTLSRTAVERGLKNTLSAKCSDCVYQIQISSMPSLRSVSATVEYDQEIKNGAFLLPVQDTPSFGKQWIAGTLRVKKSVPVLKRTLQFGERLQAEDLELAETDITFLRELPPAIADVAGMIATRTLQSRSAVVLSDLKKEPAAKKGQILKALVGNDSFEVSINVTAEESGSVGDTIKIQNPETRKMMSAVILEKGVVKVQ